MPLLAVLFASAVTAFEAWAVMLLWGALHSQALWIPTLSYGASLWLTVLVYFLVGAASAKAKAAGD